jgi:hypothetical protein
VSLARGARATRLRDCASLRTKLSTDRPLVAAAILALILIAMYPSVVFGGRTLQAPAYMPFGTGAPGDPSVTTVNSFNVDLATPAYYEWPTNVLVGKLWRSGEVPLWNPYQGAGTPLLTQFSSRVLFPYQVLQNVAPEVTWDGFTLGRLWIAGLFAFLFLRRLGVRGNIALLGGVAFMLSGSFTWFLNLEQFANSAMLVPVLFWAVEGLRAPSLRNVAPAALATALVLLAGQPETALYVLAGAGVYGVVRAKGGPARRMMAKGLLAAALGAALAAPLLLPFFDYAGESVHFHPAGGDLGRRDPTPMVLGPALFAPTITEYETYYRTLPQNGLWDRLGGYVGAAIPTLLVASIGLVVSRRRSPLRLPGLTLASMGIFVLLKNFGLPPFEFIGELPLFDQAWTPRWAGPLWTFALAAAAAIGLEMLARDGRPLLQIWGETPILRAATSGVPGPLRRGDLSAWALVGAISVGLVVLLVALTRDPIADASPIAAEALRSRFFAESIVLGFAVAVSVAIGVLFILWGGAGGRAPIALLLLLFGELWFLAPRGFDDGALIVKLLPLGYLALLAFLVVRGVPGAWRWGVPLAAGAIIIAAFLPSERLPERQNVGATPEFVRLIQDADPTARMYSGDGVLMPNFAAAVGLQDLRTIDALGTEPFFDWRSGTLETAKPSEDTSGLLWFTGNRLRDIEVDGRPERALISFKDDIHLNLPFFSFLGVRYFLAPATVDLNEPSVPTAALLENGDFASWSRGPGPFRKDGGRWADGWDIDVGSGSAITVVRAGPKAEGGARAVARHEGRRVSFLRQLLVPEAAAGRKFTASMDLLAEGPGNVWLGITIPEGTTRWSPPGAGGEWESIEVGAVIPVDAPGAVVLIALEGDVLVTLGPVTLEAPAYEVDTTAQHYVPHALPDGDGRREPVPNTQNLLQDPDFRRFTDRDRTTGTVATRPATLDGGWSVALIGDGAGSVARVSDERDGNAPFSALIDAMEGAPIRVSQGGIAVASAEAAFSLRVHADSPGSVRVGVEGAGADTIAWGDPNRAGGVWETVTAVAATDDGVASVHIEVAEGTAVHIARTMLVSGSTPLPYIPTTSFDLIYEQDGLRLYENRDALPRAFVVRDVTFADSSEEALQQVRQPGFDFRRSAVIEATPTAELAALSGAKPDSAEIVRYGANIVRVFASLEDPGLLLLTDVLASGWSARVDGESVPLYRVNGLVRGLYLDSGSHLVTFRYRPPGFALGVGIALGALALLTLLAFGGPISERIWRKRLPG